MENQSLSFDTLPGAVAELTSKVDSLVNLLAAITGGPSLSAHDQWFTIEELCAYLPDKPATTTVYRKAQKGEIPYRRAGRRLVFLRSEIDLWFNGQRDRVKKHQTAPST